MSTQDKTGSPPAPAAASEAEQAARAVNQREFRNALGCFATGVTVITGRGAQDELIGITANSFSSVSLDPPLVLFSVGRGSYSMRHFISAHNFAVNVLGEDQRELSQRFATALVDKWAGVDYVLTESACPFLSGALARFECSMEHTYDGGDHVIFVGRVLHFEYRPEGRPLLYFRGRYASLAQES
jgi:flavin reductase (DIM6/NTAB) family NADH-FMN oxidoreductase RutF